jgi:hypothetical protein
VLDWALYYDHLQLELPSSENEIHVLALTEPFTTTIFSSNCPPQKMKYMYWRWKEWTIAVVFKLTNGHVCYILFSNAYFLFCRSLANDPRFASKVQSVLLLRNGCRPVRPRVIKNRVTKIESYQKKILARHPTPRGSLKTRASQLAFTQVGVIQTAFAWCRSVYVWVLWCVGVLTAVRVFWWYVYLYLLCFLCSFVYVYSYLLQNHKMYQLEHTCINKIGT